MPFTKLTHQQERELLKVAKPIATLFLEIDRLKKEITKKRKSAKNSTEATLTKIKELNKQLKNSKKELAKTDKQQLQKGKKAINALIHYNQNLIKYIARGYSFSRKIDPEELVSEGVASIPKAIEKFNLDSSFGFSAYANFWIRQHIQTYLNKREFIARSRGKENKKVIYYDYDSKNDEQENNYLLENFVDVEEEKFRKEEIIQQDVVISINELINSLSNWEEKLVIRLLFRIKPRNLGDIYCLLGTEKEKQELRESVRIKKVELLRNYPLKGKISELELVKKYLGLFERSYKPLELCGLLQKSGAEINRIKIKCLKKLKNIAQERNLGCFFS